MEKIIIINIKSRENYINRFNDDRMFSELEEYIKNEIHTFTL